MTETSYFPESFDEVVRLVVQGQMEAAGILWDGTMQRMAEDVAENPEGFCAGRNE
jgi:hypothetical protein